MAAFNITADPQMGDYVSLSPDSLRRQRIDLLAEKIFANMTPAQTYKLGQQRGGPDTSAGRGDSSRTIALKQAIAQEKQEQQEKPDFDALDRAQGRVVAEPGISLPTAPPPTIESETVQPTAPPPTIESETVKPAAPEPTSDQLTQRILESDLADPTRTPDFSEGITSATPEDRLIANEYIAEIKKDPTATYPTVGGLTIEEQPNALSIQALVSEYTNSLDYDRSVTSFRGAADLKARQSQLGETLRPSRTPMQVTGRLQEEKAAMPMVDVPEDSEVPREGLLSRLGNAAKANPDIALAGMEGIGSLLANIGAGRAQKAADQTQRQGMARSNLVSALTGGKVRPGVAEETPQMGLLGRVGQALGTTGKLGREVSEERFERGFKEEEMGRKYDVKEAELDRKIAADGLKLSELARKEKLDEARIENWIARNTLGMDRNDVNRYRAEIYAKLGEGRLALDVDKFAQEKIEFKELMGLKGDKLALAQKIQSFDEGDINRMYALSLDEFALDERRVDALEAKGLVDKKRAEDYGRSVSIAEHAAGADRRKALQTTIRNLDKAELAEMMDPKQGALKVVNGLNSAYKDYEADANQANMNAVFQMYQRMFDPATVREGDLSIQREGQGVILNHLATLERTVGGGFVLHSSVIENMENIAQRYRASMQASAENKLDNYLNQIYLGKTPTEQDIAEAEQIRNYYNAVWNFDPTQTQVRTGNVDEAADSFVKKEFSE
jgi:hypothetical protein